MLTEIGGTVYNGVVPAFVGDFVNIGVEASTIASSGVFFGLADADTQVVLNWGVHSFESDIRIINLTDGLPAPDNSDITLTTLLPLVPPRPETVDTPEPSTFLLLLFGFASMGAVAWRRGKPH